MPGNPRDVTARVGLDPSKYEKGSERVNWQTKQMLRQQEAADRKWRALQKAHGEALAEVQRQEHKMFQAHHAALRENQKREEAAAQAAAEAQEKAQREIQEQIERTHKVMAGTGKIMLTSGAAIAAGLALSTRAAVSWESAWTGVLKTVDGTPEQLGQVEDGLRGLARTLPSTHEEIAGVAEAAGQLGVSTGAVTGFTKVMIDLGETTDLQAGDAATSIAQMATVIDPAMLKSGDGVSRFGATLVALGNNFATTESKILTTAQRISGSGALIGASSADVLALATSLSSMGIEAELGGGVASRVLTKLYSVVQSGGDDLEQFAATAGMSATDFAAAFRSDPVAALGLVTSGLNDVEASGGNVISTLSDLGFKSTEDVRVLLQLKGAGDLLTSSLETANSAWEENTALLDEANKRYDTTEAKLQIAKNTIIDAGIGIGETFLPVLADTAESVGDLVTRFAELPAPVQTSIGILGTLAATVGVVGGGFLMAYPRAVEMIGSLRDLGVISDKTTGRLQKVGPALQGIAKSAGVLAGGIAAVQILDSIASSGRDAALGVEQTASALLGLDGADLNTPFADVSDEVTDLSSALQLMLGSDFNSKMERFGQGLGSVIGVSGQVGETAQAFENMGMALAQMVDSGRGEEAEQVFAEIADAAEAQGISVAEVRDLMPAYAEALARVANEQDATAESFAGTTATVQEQSEALLENFEAMLKASGQALSLRDAQRGMEAAYDDARQALEDNGATLDISTEKGRANAAALDGIASAGLDVVESMQANGASQKELRAVMQTTRERFIKTAQSMGATKTEARDLADQLGLIPKDVRTTVGVQGVAAAQGAVNTLWNTLQNIDGKTVTAGVAIKQYGQAHLATGGRVPGQLPGFPTGGRLPGSSPVDPMQDNLVGVDESGTPRVRVRSREWLMNEPAADYYGDRLMGAINARAIPRETLENLPGLAAGGAVTDTFRRREKLRAMIRAEQRRYRSARSQAGRDAAHERAEELRGLIDQSWAKTLRLREESGSLRTDLRRGEVASQVTSGLSGAYAATDRLRDLGEGIGGWRGERLDKVANNAEKALKQLYTQADRAEKKLADARDRLEELQQVRSRVQTNVVGGFGLAGVQGEVDPWSGQQATPTGSALAAAAASYASRARRFNEVLGALWEKSGSAAIVQEVERFGVEQGIPIAEALLADLPSLKALAASYSDIESIAGQVGDTVALAVGGGQGISAAEMAVKNAQAQVDAIDRKIDNWAQRIGNELAKALGLKTRASGGPYNAGDVVLTGERGPELEFKNTAGYVLNATQTKYAMNRPDKTVNVKVTNVYPIGEKESVATNKALSYAAAVGV